MEQDEIDDNLDRLVVELRAAAFPESVVADLKRQVSLYRPGDALVFFEAEVNAAKVMGSVYFERSGYDGPLRFAHFDVDFGKGSQAPITSNTFVRASGYAVTLPEAVNLMEGRSIYREPAFDPTGQGYWVSLDKKGQVKGMHSLMFDRSDFNVAVAIRESPLGRTLDASAREKLADQLRHGDQVTMEVDGPGRRVMLMVEADPGAKDLRISHPRGKGVEVGEETAGVKMGRRR